MQNFERKLQIEGNSDNSNFSMFKFKNDISKKYHKS